MAELPPPPRVTFEELQRMAAEVMGVSPRAVTSPWHDKTAVHIGAIVEMEGRTEYRSIDVAVIKCQDADGSEEDTHASSVLFDVLEGILRRRFARRARRGGSAAPPQATAPQAFSPLSEPLSGSRLRFAPAVGSIAPPEDPSDEDKPA